ncbi:VacJ family lipoprotein [Geobacter metallireducens RCH3]|uniref:VacJ family lipoprotein fusion protein n=1 Tax=Geobacter metallireducens (strain ATCC 53774 / DSM 7210 / GS-15) TaxID=269799 RepID=Q39WY7_GEOMG|nr:VacJ family lipoprotein [Geobacter metallireducens]ABB31237.1 VacJ family lipoprotein fusion protein [Geobacter metallireducens GS-15]EHP84017.1 VacJ family lipoprotein [Geobacter metallireducens RCH3]
MIFEGLRIRGEGSPIPPIIGALLALAICCHTLVSPVGAAEEVYEYPFADPYAATVIGTPKELQAEVPRKIPFREPEVTVFEDRPVPDILWYDRKLRYSIATQRRPAPLIFLIAGMGAGHNDPKIQFLQRVFFKAGFHVVCLPSATHPNFIPAASGSGIPGFLMEDARDLYRAMELITRDVREDVTITGFDLAGYSLGADHAAFLAELDNRLSQFRFNKVLLINPPVSLYHAAGVLDEMIKKIPGGEEKFQEFFDNAFRAFTAIYQSNERVEFTGDFLFRGRKPNDENLAALIGLSFRLAVANMAFTSDVFTNAGYIKPKNLELSTTDSLTDYFKVADLVKFLDYFRDLLAPYYLEQIPGMTERQLIEQLSLRSIEQFLRNSPSVYLVHNVDDMLLAPGDIDYLKDVFGSRARIYPRGGHCGNIDHRVNVAHMLEIFRGETTGGNTGTTAPDSGEAAGAGREMKPGAEPAEQTQTALPSQEAAPPLRDSGGPRNEAFTAPRPAVISTGILNGQAGARNPKPSATGTRQIIAPRRSEAKPGLSYVIDVHDPIEPVNRALYRFNAMFDEYLFLPVTRTYEFITPVFLQDRISGIFANISEVRNLTNSILQLRPKTSATVFTRFLINSTLGIGGMWDPATDLGFPKHEEDFGQTLGWWGLKQGPYIVLPIFGPSSLRDTTGRVGDSAASYFYLYQPTDMDQNIGAGSAYTGVNAIDTRHNIPFRYYQTGSPFEYDLVRLLYKKKRELDIER